MEPTDLIGLGDHPALDFVNSTTTQGGVTIDLLADGQSYLRWLELAGLISSADRDLVEQRFSATELDAVAAEAGAIREWLRAAIATWATGTSDTSSRLLADITQRLNAILETDQRYLQLHPSETGAPGLYEHRHWQAVEQLLVPPVAAAAELFAGGKRELVRHCEGVGCTIWFYDRTKAHRRRWCSMALCGNRAKARNHRRRQAG